MKHRSKFVQSSIASAPLLSLHSPKVFLPLFVGQTFTFLKALFISNISLFTAQMAMFNFWKQISSALFIWIYLGLPYCLQLRQQNFGGGSSMGYIYLDPFSPGIKTLLSPIKYNKSEKSNFALWWWLLPGQAAKVSVMITNNSYSCWHKFTKNLDNFLKVYWQYTLSIDRSSQY